MAVHWELQNKKSFWYFIIPSPRLLRELKWAQPTLETAGTSTFLAYEWICVHSVAIRKFLTTIPLDMLIEASDRAHTTLTTIPWTFQSIILMLVSAWSGQLGTTSSLWVRRLFFQFFVVVIVLLLLSHESPCQFYFFPKTSSDFTPP
jgi:hypothetical protein